MRKMAYVQSILDLQPIKNADRIEVATIRGWQVVVKKGEFKVGDKCVYFEVDSILKPAPWNDFLGGNMRLRTIRLRRQISQGLALPLSCVGIEEDLETNTDLTERLDVQVYVPVEKNHSGDVKGDFPSFISKTDEERCQNLVDELEEWRGKEVYISEKLDGMSGSFYKFNNEFGVCSRNLELKESGGGSYWDMSNKYQLDEDVMEGNIAIQGEICGPGIQKNPLQLSEKKMFVFNIVDLNTGFRYSVSEMIDYCMKHDLDMVPILELRFKLEHTVPELLELAEGKSRLANVEREGIVIRGLDSRFSFKAISNKFLLKGGEKR